MEIYSAKKLQPDEVVNAIGEMQKAVGREKSNIFMDLYEYFKSRLLTSYYRKVESVGSDRSEKEQLTQWIMVEFFKSLLKADIKKYNSIGQITNFLKEEFLEINRNSAAAILGKTHPVKSIERTNWVFNNALKRFKDQYKRLPDLLKNDNDRENFAKIMKIREEDLDDVLDKVGQKQIQSLYSEIASDKEGNAEILLDTLKSDDPLPDELVKNREFMVLLMREIHKLLTSDQRRVFIVYNNLDDSNREEKTKEQLAKELGMDYREFRYNLDMARKKLGESNLLKEYYFSAQMHKVIKFALQHSPFEKYSSEQIIEEVLKNASR